jgi:hypothetical protein
MHGETAEFAEDADWETVAHAPDARTWRAAVGAGALAVTHPHNADAVFGPKKKICEICAICG